LRNRAARVLTGWKRSWSTSFELLGGEREVEKESRRKCNLSFVRGLTISNISRQRMIDISELSRA